MVCAGITYNAVSSDITVEYNAADGTHGASYTDPYNLFQDIYDTDVFNGWGVVSKDGEVYIFTGVRVVITGEFTFAEIDEGVVADWYGTGGNTENLRNSFAKLYKTTNKETYIKGYADRIYFYSNDSIFNISVNNISQIQFAGSSIIKNSSFTDGGYYYVFATTTHENIQIKNFTYGIWVRGTPQLFKNVSIIDCDNGFFVDMLYVPNLNATLRDIKLVDCNRDFYIRLADNGNGHLIMVDSVVSLTSRGVYVHGGTGNLLMENKTTYNATIENASGGQLTIEDKDGNVIYSETLTTDNMTETEIKYEQLYCENIDGALTQNEITTYTPFTLKVTKSGYQDLEIPDITVTAGQPTTVFGKMVQTEFVGLVYEMERELGKHLFLNESIPNIGNTGGLLPSSRNGSFYMALFTTDPGELGEVTGEATYSGYLRAKVARGDTEWGEFIGRIRNLNDITFPECQGGSETITHFAIMKQSTGSEMVCSGELSEPLEVAQSKQPRFKAYSMQFKFG